MHEKHYELSVYIRGQITLLREEGYFFAENPQWNESIQWVCASGYIKTGQRITHKRKKKLVCVCGELYCDY